MSTIVLVAFPQAASALGDCTPDPGWPAARPDLAVQVVDLVNAHRAQIGLAPLVVSPTLTTAAEWKARHMAAYGYLAHDDPAPPLARSPGDRLAACGYPQANWGENIASGYRTAQAVVDGWLASPGHRANIERPEFVATGVGVAGTQQPYWAQSFGNVVDAASSAPATPAAPAQYSAASLTPPARSSASGPSVRVSCHERRHRVACRVRNAKGATLRIALRRQGHTFARARTHVRSDDLRLRLRTLRRIHSGRYALLVRASAPSGTRERHLTFVVR